MTTVNHPIFKSNNDGDLKLESGEIDVDQQFTAQIWKMWEDKGTPVGTWLKEKPYYLPGNIPLLIFNLNKKGLDNPSRSARRSPTRSTIPNIATHRDVGLLRPGQRQPHRPDRLRVQVLRLRPPSRPRAGSTTRPRRSRSWRASSRPRRAPTASTSCRTGPSWAAGRSSRPTGWTDWNTALEIVAKSAQEVGIGITTEFPQAPTWYSDDAERRLRPRDVRLLRRQPGQPLDPVPRRPRRPRSAPVGKTSVWNYGRFKNAEVASLLDSAAAAKSDDEAKTAYAELDKIYRDEHPLRPVDVPPARVLRVQRLQLGRLPDRGRPDAPPMFQGAGIGWLFKLKRVGG